MASLFHLPLNSEGDLQCSAPYVDRCVRVLTFPNLCTYPRSHGGSEAMAGGIIRSSSQILARGDLRPVEKYRNIPAITWLKYVNSFANQHWQKEFSMTRRSATIMLPLVLLLITCSVAAQTDQANPNPRQPPLRVLARFLELTEEQIVTARGILEDRALALRPLRQELSTLNKEWRELISAEPPNTTVIGDKALEIKAVRERIAAIERGAKERFVAILLEDGQLQRLRTLRRVERLQSIVNITKPLNLY